MESLIRELRVAARGLAKRPGFTAAAVSTLAIGIAANTAVFSLVNGLLLRPLPFGEKSDRVVTLHSTHPTQAPDWDDARLSFADYEDLRAASRSFEDVGGYLGRDVAVGAEGESERVRGGSVTPNLFPMLGVEPQLGRLFEPGEAQPPGFESVLLLGHGLWQRRFGGDPGILGRTVAMNGRALTVVGVMPAGFRFPERDDVYLPLRLEGTPRDRRAVAAFGVLRTGVSLAQAQHDVDALAARLADRHPRTNRGWGIRLFSFRESAVGRDERIVSATLMGAVAFVLLIGCANLASLLLVRGEARRRELAVRTAVGASRRQLVIHMLVESALLSIVGSVLGAVLGAWAVDALVASFPEELPYWITFDLDGRVLLFTVVVGALTALAIGLVPALRASRLDVTAQLKHGGHAAATPAQQRLQTSLVVGQVALCLALLVGANLLIRSFLRLHSAGGGFDESGLLTLRLYIAGDRYDPPEAKAAFLLDAVQRLRALPGVRGAAATSSVPTDDGGSHARAVSEAGAAAGEETGISIIGSTPELFDTLRAGLVEGRTFTAQEVSNPRAEVAIVNRALAARFWPGQGAVGRRLGLVHAAGTTWLTVVGIAPDVQYEEFGEETPQSRLNAYVPYARLGYRTMALLVRCEADPAAVVPSLRAALRGLDPGLPTYDVRTMAEVRAYTTWEQRFFAQTLGVFAAVALLLACLGVYGVLAYSVSRRRREIGVRIALGARPADVVRGVVARGAVLAGLGVVLGSVLAVGVGRLLAGVLYEVDGSDPLAVISMGILLAAVVLLASALPARRAAGVDPMTVLRCE